MYHLKVLYTFTFKINHLLRRNKMTVMSCIGKWFSKAILEWLYKLQFYFSGRNDDPCFQSFYKRAQLRRELAIC